MVHAAVRAAHAPEDVAAAHDDGDLDTQIVACLGDLGGDPLHDVGVDAEVERSIRERLPRELEHHSAVPALGHQQLPSWSCGRVTPRRS
jgi:hypothetical protein